MHNPKIAENEVQRFEKEVQQKMEELEFSPSAAVWANVEKAISVEKKRRVPFFWLWLLPAFLLLGGTGIYWMAGRTATPITHGSIDEPPSVQSNVSPSNAGVANTTRQDGATVKNNQARVITKADDPYFAAKSATSLPKGTTSLSKSATSLPKSATSLPKSTTSLPKGTTSLPKGTTSLSKSTTSLSKGPTSLSKSTTSLTNLPKGRTSRARGATSRTETEAATTQEEITTAEGIATEQGEDASRAPAYPGAKAAEKTANPLWADIHLRPVNLKSIAAIQAAPLAKRPALAKALPGSKRPWEAGFTGGIGISSINQTLFKGASVVANDSRNLAAPVPVTGSVSQTYVSKIQPDLSFWAGIFLQKPILNHLSVSFGLNLHYYSTKVSTGDKVVDNASSSYYSSSSSLLSYAAAPTPAQSYPYYAVGDKQSFINRYYFLEIPGSIQWQISHTRTLPLFWEVGGSLSYLMSSNAIYYNTKAGVYYKDGQVSNRTQFNLSTALMVSLPLKGFQMQVGPQLQYGVTSLLNSESSGGQHLFYGGLKLVIFPGKSHKPGRRFFHGQ